MYNIYFENSLKIYQNTTANFNYNYRFYNNTHQIVLCNCLLNNAILNGIAG